MTKPQKTLVDLLSGKIGPEKPDTLLFSKQILQSISTLCPKDLARFFVDTTFLTTSMQFLKEEYWLRNQKELFKGNDFKNFISEIFKTELSPISYLQNLFNSLSFSETKVIYEQSLLIEKEILQNIKSKSSSDQKIFASTTLNLMSALFVFENKLRLEKKLEGRHLSLSLYRTFDSLDEVFDLNYNNDENMKTDLKNTERLYEGAGVGVQSSYASILMALHHLNPPHGCRFVDLGSGYGRVGLAIGLLRPDIDFVGYEFVEHRVNIANACCQNLSLESHVRFLTQDLSLKTFQIIDADVYYMYDPFSEETYSHILNQLVTIARRRKIAIITKGNARDWLINIAKNENWSSPQEFDDGNLCLFFSY